MKQQDTQTMTVERLDLTTVEDLQKFLRANCCRMEVGSTCRGKWGATISKCDVGVIAAAEREDFAAAVRAAVLEALATMTMLERTPYEVEVWN